MLFSAERSAQVAAFFTEKAGSRINVLRLIKLIYLSDRESMDRYGYPITFDRLVSMPHGPVPSMTLNLANGFAGKQDGQAWERWIHDREDHYVSLRSNEFRRDDLEDLSDADFEVLEEVWAQFSAMSPFELSDYTHTHCAEWRDPDGSSFPIHDRDVFVALGRSREEAVEEARAIQDQREIDRVFAAL